MVARRQLLDAGIGARAIDHRLAVGRLHQHHRGVYSPGHRRLSRHGQWIAAVLAAGPRAVLSHRAAASLWNLRRFLSNLVDVTVPHGFHRRPGLCFHRAVLPPDEVTVIDAIPVTTVPRTVLDLAAVVSKDVLERACAEAEFLRLSDTLSLRDLLDRHPHRPGVALRAVLAEDHYRRGITKSVLEERFLALLDEDGLPRPELNVDVQTSRGWVQVDCLWRDAGLVVELDGRAGHERTAAFEADRARDRALAALRLRVIRLTCRVWERESSLLKSDLRSCLATASPGSPRASEAPRRCPR